MADRLREPRPAITGSGRGAFGTLRAAFRQAVANLVATMAWFVSSLGVILPSWLVLWLVWRVWRFVRARRRVKV